MHADRHGSSDIYYKSGAMFISNTFIKINYDSVYSLRVTGV